MIKYQSSNKTKNVIAIILFTISTLSLGQVYVEKKLIGENYLYKIDKLSEYSKKDFLSEANLTGWCEVNFYDEVRKYEVIFTTGFTEDIISETIISYGDYIENGDDIILTDEKLKYEMHLKQMDDTLEFTKSFCGLMDKVFIHEKVTKANNYDWYTNFTSVNKIIKRNQKNKSHVRPLPYGVYTGEVNSNNLYLEITPSDGYFLYFEKILLSRGKWEKKGNDVLLYDASMKTTFYALITRDGIVSQLIPADYEGITLKRMSVEKDK